MRTIFFLLLIVFFSFWLNSLGVHSSLLDISIDYTKEFSRFNLEANLLPFIMAAIIAYLPYMSIYKGIKIKFSKK